MATRTRRRWVVGVVSCDDVKSLQLKVNAYRSSIEDAIDALPADFKGATGDHGSIAWMVLREKCNAYEEETCLVGPLPGMGLFSGSQFERGRALITELDGWRDWLSKTNDTLKQKGQPTITVPAPVATPKSDVGPLEALGEGIEKVGTIILALGALWVWHEHESR